MIVLVLAVSWGVSRWWFSAEGRLASAAEALAAGDMESALEWLTIPEATPSTRDRALILRARIAVERGDLRGAVQALDPVDPHGSSAADFAYWKGRTLYAASQPLLALQWLDRAFQLRPTDANAARWLAAAAYDLGDRTTAVAALRAVTTLDPEDPRPWRTLGVIFKENVEYEAAQDAFEHALRLNRAQPDVRLERAEVRIALGDAAGALEDLEMCRGRVAEARRAALRAECFRLKGDRNGVRSAVDEGLTSSPDNPDLLTRRAQLDVSEGHFEAALERLNRAVVADPHRAETLYQRGLVLRRLGRDEEGLRDLEHARAVNRLTSTMSALNDEAARNPTDAEVRHKLGNVCAELGKIDMAASWYRAALACDPHHAAARLGLNALAARPPGR